MKLTKQLRAEILDMYEAFWGSLFNVDIEIYSLLLDDNYRLIGTTDKEVFFNKKDAINFLKATGDQLAGNIERRKSKIKIEPVDNLILITEQFDAYVLIENDWSFYGKTRVSTWLQQKTNGWKIAQQHFSLPDTKAEEGQTIGLEKISKENLELREAIKRRTIELEHKNRELEIETALERVRARTMAMQRSDELSETAAVLFQEFKKLGEEDILQITIGIYNEAAGVIEFNVTSWAGGGEQEHRPFNLSIEEPTLLKPAFTAWKQQKKSIVVDLTGEQLEEWIKYRNANTGVTVSSADTHGRRVITVAYFSKGHISISSPEPKSPETIQLLERFAGVFDLTYTRFLDLKNAEAQVREAQIEAALERVRSRSMAMHKSDELLEAGALLYSELSKLGIQKLTSGYMLIDEDEKMGWNYGVNPATGQFVPKPIGIPLTETKVLKSIMASWKKKEPLLVIELNPEETIRHQTYMAENAVNFPITKEQLLAISPERLVVHTFNFKHGFLLIVGGVLLTKEQQEMITRFAKVFEMTYRRFLDLKQAEEQTREAQIELGLERVRARAMAMQNSDELKELIGTVFTELTKLDLVLTRCIIMIYDTQTNGSTWWMANSEAPTEPIGLYIKYHEHSPYSAYIKSWKERKNKFQYILEGKDKNDWDDFLFVETELSHLPDFVIAGMKAPDRVYLSGSFNNFGCLNLASLEPLSDEHFDILLRFAKVFDLTYTRFNDLQKAEAQAREAQIELGLERVRARAMAMQRSDELAELVDTVFKELTKLHFTLDRCIIIIVDEKSMSANYWMANPESKTPASYHVQLKGIPYLDFTFNSWKERKAKIVYDLKGDEKTASVKYIFSKTELKNLPDLVKEGMKNTDRIFLNSSFNNFGCLQADTVEPLSEDNLDIIYRFAKVFDLTYTRFNDLQKAEAQAREAQIELGLERVRARAMAMQKSNELKELIGTVSSELAKLDIVLDRCFIIIYDIQSLGSTWWMSNPETPSEQIGLFVKYHEHTPYSAHINAWKERKIKWEYILEGEVKKSWDKFLFAETELSKLPPFVIDNMRSKEKVYLSSSFNNFGYLTLATLQPLSNEQFDIMLRFAKVFDLTYTRFNDLQKAEAQAREAQIELGLERVRARAMAMQKSDELSELVDTVFKELTKLDFALNWCIINIIDESSLSNTVWAANPDINKVPESYHMLFEDYPFHHAMMKGWKERKAKTVYILEGQEKKVYDEYLFNETEFRKVPEAAQAASRAMEKYVVSFSFSNFGGLQTVGDAPLSDANLDILSRFGKVFDLTYTRFNDLKQAEAQARESQIQLALERVRARTMAMQNSNEFPEVAALLFEQVKSLGIETYASGFNIWDKEHKNLVSWMSNPRGTLNPAFEMPIHSYEQHKRIYNSWKNQDSFIEDDLQGSTLVKHYKFLRSFPLLDEAFTKSEEAGIETPERQVHNNAHFSNGYLLFITTEPCPQHHHIFKRFAKVFEQTYTRFNDLKQAEAQARESQIQLALERVRARTMAMQKSDELPETSFLLFQQVKELGETTVQNSIGIVNEEAGFVELSTTVQGHNLPHTLHVPIDDPYVMSKAVAAWKAKHKSLKLEFTGQELKNYNEHRNSFFETKVNFPEDQWNVTIIFFSKGWLSFSGNQNISDETFDLLKRFAAVFEQTYTRFNDLKQAEAQARESQIELGLERVRARAMAMQKSVELADAAQLLYHEFGNLGINTFSCGYMFIDEAKQTQTAWVVLPDGSLLPNFIVFPITGDQVLDRRYKDWKEKKPLHVFEIQGEANKEHHRFLSNYVPPFVVEDIFSKMPDRIVFNCANFSDGYLLILATDYFSPDEQQTIIRFAKVFEQTYTRFLDLQKAEAQTREAQIEAALERVRSKTMAMHNSLDVGETVATLFDQLVQLDITTNRCGILIFSNTNNTEVWTAKSSPAGKATLIIGHLDVIIHPMLQSVRHAWMNKETFHTYELAGDDIKNYYSAINNYRDYPTRFNLENLPSKEIHSDFFFPEGAVFAFTSEPIPEEAALIFKRFAGVFGQTYRRYLDLQRAEANAREATIEAALEKVRGKAMAMHNSNDLSATASMVFTELRKLGISPIRCGVGILNKESRKAQLYSATSSQDGDSLALIGWVQLSDHPVLTEIYDSWINNEEYYPELEGEQMKSYYELLLQGLPVKVPDTNNSSKQYGHFIPFSIGCLYAWSDTAYNETEIRILKRFASIIDLTFRRYFELQRTEASAKEAIRQASLDRIRADIASMRTVSDLQRITPLIWDELTIIGIPFIRCGVFIMDEAQKLIHTFLSTPDGKAIGAFHLPYTTLGNIQLVLNNWRQKKNYVDHWNEDAFLEFADILMKQGAISSPDQYLSGVPHGGFYLHFLPFFQGMLYVGNTTQLGEDEIRLIQSVADAFSTAYARYEDFNKLEAAKQQIENTLTNLKQAQAQLIQSEKMASLGELTAGIAHEIQNPLNFVNNFSDVSTELIDEMNEEITKGNLEDAKQIAVDLKQNLEKINHHGKRAGDIVKGMLQHSRTSSAVKEPTDINKLADEYLRLAYHGLRAKDKTFNATMKTDFDESIGKITVIPQDIGRVILNLITNAFYVVAEKKKKNIAGYEPTISISTKKEKDKIEIKVQDNGNGIPEKVLDKIFQPFFTTKPTGQGTGLGLSLSYDIVKAHGGEIKVNTKENEGTEFIVVL